MSLNPQNFITEKRKNTIDQEMLIAKRAINKSVIVNETIKSNEHESTGRPRSNQGYTPM